MEGLYAPVSGGGDFKNVPAGTYFGVCTGMFDLGMQPGSAAYPKPKHVLMFRMEIPSENIDWGEDGAPFDGPAVIYERRTFSMHENSRLRELVQSWIGRTLSDDEARKFDLTSLVGKAATLNVVHNKSNNGKTYANVAAFAPLPRGVQPIGASGELLVYHHGNKKAWDKLPAFVQELIRKQALPYTEADHDEAQAAAYADRDPFDDIG